MPKDWAAAYIFEDISSSANADLGICIVDILVDERGFGVEESLKGVFLMLDTIAENAGTLAGTV